MRDLNSRATTDDAVAFVAVMATALALGGALAHALELPNKIGLAGENYMIVQTIYRGWNLLAFVLLFEVASMIFLASRYRFEPRVFRPTIVALGCVAAAQAIFWIWTWPANRTTANWTVLPENFEAVRAQWEYSHLAGAVFQLLAMIAIVVAVLGRDRAREPGKVA